MTLNPDWSACIVPLTCEGRWHISHPGMKRCDCGEKNNPSYRNWLQRFMDRRQFNRIKR